MITILIELMLIHFLADFVFQSDRIAKGKSKSLLVLTEHLYYYGWVMAIGLLIISWGKYALIPAYGLAISQFLWFNIIAHWFTDLVTSRINAKLWQEGELHWFFVGIGADQFIHLATMFLSFKYFIL